ncbi:aspartate kinase [Candidatus Methylacidiphilum infernorum]|uniref:Aspartokinase n=1 Tax=Candidatus Methylacidiphilum infernorum TaxID=511746 RepID=A0ABX7PY37_9BACT|nr:aspartate kinase [Candidatus Methylacidiphilum infernorum]QSR87504.1 aspartate kinase [Candidatus Methylacidiphilum infernorum]
MALFVQKYGGTSVGSVERIKKVAERIADFYRQGHDLVVVVSAMSGVTDQLLQLASQLHPEPSEREVDVLLSTGEQTTIALLSIALHALKIPAVSLTGAQAGIITDARHTRAKILNISPKKIKELLRGRNVVVVAGFQGQNVEGHITTLGRGGSDLTAIAIAAVLHAQCCQIYTDVEGVYTADPRIVPRARKIEEISYDELLEMAASGSKVMQARSVEFAKKFKVPFEVRSSFTNAPGTIVKEEVRAMEKVVVRAVSLEPDQAKVTILGVPDKPGIAAKVFSRIAEAEINVDMIVQNISDHGLTDITFTVHKSLLKKAMVALDPIVTEIGAREVRATEGVAKLSVVGIGMRSHSGVAALLFSALAEAGINVQMISTSEIKIAVIIDEAVGKKAAQVVHDAFKLDQLL